MLRQQFVSERVFPSPAPTAPDRTCPEMRLPPLSVQEDLLQRNTVCFLGHSVFDDLRLMLDENNSDLRKDFNLDTVIPVSKAVRGLHFTKMIDDCLSFLDHRRCEIIVWQMAGNDLDSHSSVSSLTERYLEYAHKFIRYFDASIVIICEALPRTRTRHVSLDSYFDRRKRFNLTMSQHLLVDGSKSGPLPSHFKDRQVWFWCQEKLQGTSQLKDGVHLTRQGVGGSPASLRLSEARPRPGAG